MREVGSRNRDGSIGMLGYTDQWGEREYLYFLTDLCDRAGCLCVGTQIVCYDSGNILFVRVFQVRYEELCVASCRCFEEDVNVRYQTTEVPSDSSSNTWSSASSASSTSDLDRDWAAENAQRMRQVYNPFFVTNYSQNGRSIENSGPPAANIPPNRLNKGRSCLAGQAAGWVFENYAARQCCPGYAFSALTTSEAYVNYGIPIGYLVAGVWSIGMCLKSISG